MAVETVFVRYLPYGLFLPGLVLAYVERSEGFSGEMLVAKASWGKSKVTPITRRVMTTYNLKNP